MQKKHSILFFVFITIGVLLSGCQDIVEIDEEVYPLVIGVDKGVNNVVRVTLQFPSYRGESAGGGGGMQKKGGSPEGGSDIREKAGTLITTVEASTILEGINLLNTSVSRAISLTHAKMIVFSEEFAKLGVGEYLAPMMRYRETRRIMHVVVCRGKAEEFILENIPTAGANPSKALELMVTQSMNSGLFPRVTFVDFYKSMLSPYEQAYCAYVGVNSFDNLAPEGGDGKPSLKVADEFLAGDIPRRGGPKREFAGTAVFDGDKLVGTLNTFETRCFLLAMGDFKRGIITMEDKKAPNKAIPLDTRTGRQPKMKARFENGIPVIDLKLSIEADIGAIQSRIDYERLNKIDDLNNQFKEYILNGILKVIDKSQREFKSDIFGFGQKVAHNFLTIDEWETYYWLKHYSEARVNVEVDVNIRRSGLMIHSEPIRGSEGKITPGKSGGKDK